jgi:hypothetical protein
MNNMKLVREGKEIGVDDQPTPTAPSTPDTQPSSNHLDMSEWDDMEEFPTTTTDHHGEHGHGDHDH